MTEEKKNITLKKIPIRYLWDGMVLSDDLYNESGKVLLIRAGERITEKTIGQLKNLGTEDACVMTCEETYEKIMNAKEVPPEIRQEMMEDKFGYTKLRKEVRNFLGMIEHAAEPEYEAAQEVTGEVTEKLGKMNFHDFFECINVPRKIDEDLQRHSLNIAFLNGMMGYWLKMPEEQIQLLVMAGLLHDIGKTQIPEQILFAPRKLTKEEYEVIKQHPVYSYELLGDQYDASVRDAVRHHHERLDGLGYPDQLSGDEISVFARITSICDIYDAMVSKRSYKEERLPFDILDKMKHKEYGGLDPELVAVFIKNMIRHFKNSQVIMSDGITGIVSYIPPTDIDHPVIVAGDVVRQVDDTWYCRKVLREEGEY